MILRKYDKQEKFWILEFFILEKNLFFLPLSFPFQNQTKTHAQKYLTSQLEFDHIPLLAEKLLSVLVLFISLTLLCNYYQFSYKTCIKSIYNLYQIMYFKNDFGDYLID